MYTRPTRDLPPAGHTASEPTTTAEINRSSGTNLTGVAFHALREIAHHNSRIQESLSSQQSPYAKRKSSIASSVQVTTPRSLATESLSSAPMTDRAGSADVEMKGETVPSSAARSISPAEKDEAMMTSKDEPSTNGTHQTEEDDDLSPPPDIMESPPADERPQDEIVVNANRKGTDRSSPLQVTSDQEDEGVTQDLDDDDDEPIPVAPYPKRKRQSAASELNDDDTLPPGSPDDSRGVNNKYRMVSARRTAAGFKHAILGFWRDSPVPDQARKHAVVGFIDIRDRLRTRIQITTRDYDKIDLSRYPVPPGPGGSWVTFERVVFEPYLVGLNHHHVKEFVKQRAGIDGETPEERHRNNMAAVEEARRRVIANPPPDTAPQPVVAYGDVIPDDAIICSRSEIAKRRKLGSGVGVGTINGGAIAHHQRTQPTPPRMGPRSMGPPPTQDHDFPSKADPVPVFDALFGTRPTRVVIGCWKPSDAANEVDRHAVLGILGQNDMFRAKVVRETRDGRFYDGNFPNGAGALWIQWNEIVLEPQLRGLNRAEVKEYVRVRQWQMDRYSEKSREDKVANETSAVYVAQQRVAHGVKVPPGNGAAIAQDEEMDDTEYPDGPDPRNDIKPSASALDLRSSYARADGRTELPQARHALPSNDRVPGRTPIAARRDFDTYATREIERLGHQEARRAHFAASHDTLNLMHGQHGNSPINHQGPSGLPGQMHGPGHAPSPHGHQQSVGPGHGQMNGPQNPAFSDRITQLDHIWKMQEEHRSNRPSSDDTKFFGGVKYERKANGFWSGKLVSSGTIITIDGEDYVEYRVLTKPQFF
ncbi:hypothetical protein F5X68DRAFT_266339 [Plectosphaerella plurivora]|uniref:Uncharacterized protein n=1 Tax=Plectosphaerella plurivora TaxID=936078 RepID=A0A9P8V0Z1_9PEZI|nr:hypothetical protein F5X68DRAFT_266339 [Plectosphaerella plurivora]